MSVRGFFLRAVIWVAIFFTAFSAALVLLFESGALTPSVVEAVDSQMAKAGLTLNAAALQWRPWSGLSLTDVRLGTRAAPNTAQASRHLVSVRRIEVGYRVTDLLLGNLRFSRVKLVGPDLDLDALLEWSATMSKRTTVSTGGPVVRVEKLRLEDGRVRGRRGDLLAELALDANFEAGRGTWHSVIDKAKTHMTLGRFDERVEVSGAMGMHGGTLDLDDVRVASAGGAIALRGKLDPRGEQASEVVLHGETVPLQKVGEWFGVEHPILFADLRCDLIATGRPDSLRLSGDLTGRRADGIARDITFVGTRVGRRLVLESFRFSAEKSLVDVTGQLDFDGGPSVEGVAVLRHFAPGTALADSDLSVIQDVDGVIRFAGTGLTRRTFRGSADVRIDDGSVFGVDLGAGTFHLTLNSGALSLENARLMVGGAQLQGSGTISADDRVQARFAGDIADLKALALPKGTLGTWVTQGRANAEIALSGPLGSPKVDAALNLADLSVADLDASVLRVTARTERLAPDARWDFHADGSGVGRGERRFERFAAEGSAEKGEITVRTAELSSPDRGLALVGSVDLSEPGKLSAKVDRLEMRAPNDVRWVNNGTIKVDRTPATTVLSGIDLRSGGGSLVARASFDSSGTQTIRATGRAVDLGVIAPLLPKAKPAEGRIDFDADATIGPDSLHADVKLDVGKGHWGETQFEHLSGRITCRDDRVKVEQFALVGPSGQANITGEIVVPNGGIGRALADSAARAKALEHAVFRHLDARVEAPDFSWLWKQIPKAPVTGGAGTVSLRLDGPFLGPSAELHAVLAGGMVGAVPLDSLIADATFDGEVLAISYGQLRAGGGEVMFSGIVPLAWTTTSPKPRLRPGRSMDLRMDAQKLPLGSLATLIALFRQLDGTADAKLALQGEPGALAFDGDFAITNGRLTIPTFADPLVNGTGTGSFDEKGVELTSGRFSDGRDGVVEGHGRVEIQNLRAKDFNLDVSAHDYHYHSSFNGIRGVGSGKMQILAAKTSDGRLVPNYVGSFRASRADIGEQALLPPSSESSGVELPPGVVAPPEESQPALQGPVVGPAAPAAFFADIHVTGDGNLWVRTPEMDCELAGDIHFLATERAMGITGTVHTLRGSYSVVNTRFDVKRAEVEFVDPANPGDSYIDAEATTRVLDENVTATVTGTVLAPQIHLTTESGMSEPEIYELLALRIKRDETTAQGPINEAFRNSAVAAVTNRWGGHLAGEVGLDTFTYQESQQGVRPSVTVGKNVGRDVYLKYKQAVGAAGTADPSVDPSVTRESEESPERALTVEYRLNQTFMLQGETGTLPQGDEYLNVDLRAEWGY